MLKRIQNLSILSQLLLVFVPLMCIYICSNFYFDYTKGIEAHKNRLYEKNENIKEGVKVFIDNNDLSLSLIELEQKDRITSLASEILSRFRENLQMRDLNVIRDSLDMDLDREDLYVFNKKGIIINTTKEGDLGFNLFDLGTSYMSFFNNVMADGKLHIERVAVETSTKNPIIYAYQAINNNYMLEIGIKYESVDSLINDFNQKIEDVKNRYPGLKKVELYGATEAFPPRTKNSSLSEFLEPIATSVYKNKSDSSFQILKGDTTYNHSICHLNIRNHGYYEGFILYLQTDNSAQISIFNSAFKKFMWDMLWSLIILVIIIYFLSRQLASPIRKLAKKVDRIANENEIENHQIKGNAEVKTLSKNFNFMLKNIQHHKDTLNEKIKQRTEELESKNSALEQISNDKSLLIREIHHRIKNNLQIISSLLSLELRKETIQNPAEVITNCKNRISSMGVLHDMLYNKSNYVKVNATGFLNDIANVLKETIAESAQINVLKNKIEIDNTKAIAIGLITNEAVTNAIKHGYDKDETKNITISMFQLENNLILKIVNDGKPILLDQINTNNDSLGLTIIKAFTERINGTYTIKNNESNEVQLEIVFPI